MTHTGIEHTTLVISPLSAWKGNTQGHFADPHQRGEFQNLHLLMLPEQLVPLEEILVLQLLLDQLVFLLLLTLLQIPDASFPVCGEEKEQDITHLGHSSAQETPGHPNRC